MLACSAHLPTAGDETTSAPFPTEMKTTCKMRRPYAASSPIVHDRKPAPLELPGALPGQSPGAPASPMQRAHQPPPPAPSRRRTAPAGGRTGNRPIPAPPGFARETSQRFPGDKASSLRTGAGPPRTWRRAGRRTGKPPAPPARPGCRGEGWARRCRP